MLNVQRHIFSAMVVLCGMGLASTDLRAQDLANGWGPTALEISKLPDYCQRFFLQKALPPNCDGVHHLCAGKVLLNRAMSVSIPKQERNRIFGSAKREVDYIFGRQNASCPLMDASRATQMQIRTLEPMFR